MVLLLAFTSNFVKTEEHKCIFPVMAPSIGDMIKGNFEVKFQSEGEFFKNFNERITQSENIAEENNYNLEEMMDFYASQAVEALKNEEFRENFENLICTKVEPLDFNKIIDNYFECDELAIKKFPNKVFTVSNSKKVNKAYPRCKLNKLDTCIDLGFNKGTEGLKNCVLELS